MSKRKAEESAVISSTTDEERRLLKKRRREEKAAKKERREKKSAIIDNADHPKVAADTELSKAERKAAKKIKKAAKQLEVSEAASYKNEKNDKKKQKQGRRSIDGEERSPKKNKRKGQLMESELQDVDSSVQSDSIRDGLSSLGTPAESKISTAITSPEPQLLAKFRRAVYQEDKRLSAIPQFEIDSYLTSSLITITDPLYPTHAHRPITKFDYLPAKDEIQREPFKSFAAPTPIQAATWPSLLAGRDVIGVAETGSGKTLAFGVPCIRHITDIPQKKRKLKVKAVILSPTRELAMQINDQMTKLAEPAGLKVACVYGGVPKDPQIQALKSASIVVATPGRLNDLINDDYTNLGAVSYLVLDEADRMLDKGFEEEIKKIISTTPTENRQTLMFTATWPASVRDLAATFMDNPVKVNIGDNPSGELRANTRIAQSVEVVEPYDKQFRLLQLLKQYQSGKSKNDRILVFCLYKKEATRIENFIRAKSFNVAGIHGDLGQAQRTASLDAFKAGQVPILVATDVAARGLDIPAVKLVINVTFPLTAEDYVHRIGRTGRAGMEGKAITLFTEQDKALSGA